MAANTCMSVITYQSEEDLAQNPFWQNREDFANTMYSQGKTEAMPNWVEVAANPQVGYRLWVDHAAAQEFLDYVIANAPTYNITLVSTGIQDL
jgi:hypothetical protein